MLELYVWVHAMVAYHHVSKEVEPKRIRLKTAEGELQRTTQSLNIARSKLKNVELNLKNLKDKYDTLVAESQSLEHEVELCSIKIKRADQLIGGLGGEKIRWNDTIKDLDINYNHLIGDIIISAASIAYLGVFTNSYRKSLLNLWYNKLNQFNILYTPNCNIQSTLANPVEIQSWHLAGLPSDTYLLKMVLLCFNHYVIH